MLNGHGDDGAGDAPIGLLGRFVEAYRRPRVSARRILFAQPSGNEALLMVVASYFITTALLHAAQMAAPDFFGAVRQGLEDAIREAGGEPGPPPGLLEQMAFGILLTLLMFWVGSSLAWFVGVQAGGKSTRRQIMGVVAWHALATTPLSVVVQIAMAASSLDKQDPVPVLLYVGGGLYGFYMFAAFIAEAHGFRKTGLVMMACFGVAFVIALALGLIVGLLTPPS